MKKIYGILLAALMPLLGLTACDTKDEIVFESQLPQFELREDAVLMEVIMPSNTTADDEIYISGDFNGGDDAAIGNPKWRLQQARDVDYKWGIYLFPGDFISGKTPADGYHFVSLANGPERTFKNQEVVRTEYGNTNTRINLTVDRWKSYFDTPADPGEIEHDGYVVYVDDQTGWNQLYLYQWGDVNDLGGGWPGTTPTGSINIGGVTYKYFDMGEANNGLNQNLIFNNGEGTQLPDFAFTIDRDIFLRITDKGCEEIEPGESVTHDGYTVFVVNLTGWEDLTLYQWGDVNDLGGGWPGVSPTGNQVINGVVYTYFDMGEANTGLNQNLIFSNNGSSQLPDFAYTIDHDVYLELTNVVKEIDPANYTGGGDTPGPVEPTETYCLYVCDNTGWNDLAVYAWGDAEVFGAWPGAVSVEARKVNGKVYWKYPVSVADANVNLIFNNNGEGTQFDGPNVTFDQDIYITVTSDSAVIDEISE